MPIKLHVRRTRLQLLHSNNVSRLYVVLILLNLFLQVTEGDLLIFNDHVDLKLLDTETNSDKLGRTPDETVFLDTDDVGLELFEVRLIICNPLVI